MRKSNEKITKRTISIKNKELLDRLFEDERETRNTSDSAIFEESTLFHYFGDNEKINSIIINNIYNKNFVKKTLKDVCDYYSVMPNEVNDSHLSIIDFIFKNEITYKCNINGKEKIISKFKKDLKNYIAEIENFASNINNTYLKRRFKTPENEYIQIDESIINNLKDTQKYIDEKPDVLFNSTDIALIVMNIHSCWYLGSNGKTSLKNWKLVWDLLSDICELSCWEDTYESRHNLVMMLRNLKKDSFETYKGNKPILNRIIQLKNKSILTTKDAVIVKEDDTLNDEDFEYAKRLIHGYNGKSFTDYPIIFLYNNSDASVYTKIACKKAPKDEFNDETDIFAVPIYQEEKYFDERIVWYSV